MKPSLPNRGRRDRGLNLKTLPYLVAGLAIALSAPDMAGQAQAIAEVQITPETMTLGVGQRQPLFAAAFDARGNLIASAKFTFRSSDTMIAQVRKDGVVVGVNPGLAKVEAQTQGRRASMAVLITGNAPGAPGRAAAVTLSLDPASVNLFPGDNVRITPRAVKENGSPAFVGRVIWISRSPEIASVDSGGVVTGRAPGRATIEVSSGSKLVATAVVEVAAANFVVSPQTLTLSPGDVDTIRAVAPSQGNRELRSQIQWRSADSSVASVISPGTVRANGPGKTDIIASGYALERRAAVVVHREAEALVVSPQQSAGPIQVPLRATRQFTAVAEAADSTPIPEARVVWELGDTTIATFDPATGVFTPRVLGTTTLTARLAGIRPAIWTIHVIAGDIAIEPARVGLPAGQRLPLAASIRDEHSSSPGQAPGIRWSSDRPDLVVVREGGIVEGLSPGRAMVTATTAWGKSATADVFVVGDVLLSSNRSGSFGIYQLRTTGSLALLPLLGDSGTNIQAALSPDRTRIAFSSNRGGNFDIFVMDSDARNLRRLTTDPRNEGDPAWTPDGTRIAYTSTRGNGTQIAMLSPDGSQVVLTSTAGGNHSPAVSPDGSTIAFISGRDGNQELYAMGIDGSNPRRLTRSSVRESSPRFFPDGELAFAVERGGGSTGSRIIRMSLANKKTTSLLQTDEPVASLAISREGDRLAYVVGRIADATRGRVDFSFFLQSTAAGSRPVAVPLKPGEQILTPSF